MSPVATVHAYVTVIKLYYLLESHGSLIKENVLCITTLWSKVSPATKRWIQLSPTYAAALRKREQRIKRRWNFVVDCSV